MFDLEDYDIKDFDEEYIVDEDLERPDIYSGNIEMPGIFNYNNQVNHDDEECLENGELILKFKSFGQREVKRSCLYVFNCPADNIEFKFHSDNNNGGGLVNLK